tara:strand:- start:6576 stop:7121 length:546 start_codon:yes stop_codon:yes gene_type:complete
MSKYTDKRSFFNPAGNIAKGVKIKMEGKWTAASWMMASMPMDIRNSYIAAQVTIGKKLKQIIKDHIKNSDLGWEPLADSTRDRKGHGRPWYDTGAIYNNIDIITKGTNVFVGVRPGVMHPKGKRTLTAVAASMEYGTNKMVARPLFLPSSKELKRSYVNKVFGIHLTRKMLSKYGVRPKYM